MKLLVINEEILKKYVRLSDFLFIEKNTQIITEEKIKFHCEKRCKQEDKRRCAGCMIQKLKGAQQ